MKKFAAAGLLLLTFFGLFAQVDSSAVQMGATAPADDSSWLLIIGMIMLLGFATALVLGLVGLGICAVVLAGLTMAGILSVSVIAGWYKRSVYAGLKWFVYLSFCTAGIAGVSLVAFIVKAYHLTTYTWKALLGWGIPAGIFGGLVCGWIVLLICKRIYSHFGTRFIIQS